MLQRALTGVVFVAVLVAAIVLHPYALSGLFLLIALLGQHEFYRLSRKAGAEPQVWTGLLTGVVMYVAIVAPKHGLLDDYRWLLLLLPLLAISFVAELYRKKTAPFTNLAYQFLGLIYVVLPFALFTYFADTQNFENDWTLALGYFLLIWANDTFAYLAGRTFGKHKLFERISPKKTWEGTVGGVIASMGIAALLWWGFGGIDLVHWLVIGFIIVVFGSLGDLVESMFKRSIDIKDSGTILPGHGGILDRFDGVLISAPVVFAYLYLVVRT